MSKRIISILTVGLLLVAMLTGTVMAGKVKLRFLQPGGNLYKQSVEFAKEYMKLHPNVEIEVIEVGWSDAYSKIMTMVAAGNAPDIMYIGTRWIPALAQMNAIQPLDKFISEEKKDLYFDSLLKGTYYQGKLYALPRSFSTKALIYRTDLIPEPPETWDELVEVAKRVQKEHEGIYGFGIAGAKHVSTTTQFFNYVYQNGGSIFDSEGNILLDSPQSVKALQFYVDLYRKHKVVPNPIEYNREELPNLFKTGKIAMFVCGPWAKPMIGLDPDNEKVPYASAPLPRGRYMATTLVSDSLVLSSQSEHIDEAWKYLNWITSLENQKKHDLINGMAPAMEKELEDPAFTEDPFFKTYVDMIPKGQPQPLPLAWEPFQDVITGAIQKALLGMATPEEALKEAVTRIEAENLAPVKH
ncbi:ABC transporter substrate-binding protein [Halothermothrix orenii]|uniref:Maltodextrin-binding protein n=1 Tax=Halothermothrix orenii (strain H 168 / OCM 544 / DSM 9562) TaxID=373903 RepID=B8D085_HALOH|nr:sugar ABC transporter substrate-binding protein [Halothermothrix orenii]ACL68839.1 extracellular solute-binding protein family 1 [Halothermothrix orenii H 168]